MENINNIKTAIPKKEARVSVEDNDTLIAQARNGDERALDTLIKKHSQKLYTSIFLLIKDHDLAKDIMQDTWIKVLEDIKNGKYKEEGKFLSWVMRIGHNLVMDHFRKIKRSPPIKSTEKTSGSGHEYSVDDEGKLNQEQNTEEEIFKKLDLNRNADKLKYMLSNLAPDQREIIELRHFAGLKFKEIASLLNISTNTALGRMRYALINLRKIQAEIEIREKMSLKRKLRLNEKK